MSREVCTSVLTPERGVGSDEMRTPENVLEMRRLHGLGWGTAFHAVRHLDDQLYALCGPAGRVPTGGRRSKPDVPLDRSEVLRLE